MQLRYSSLNSTRLVIRTFDLIFALSGILLLSPIMLVLAICLRFTGEGEVIYRQERIGKGGEKFELLKFATMVKNSPNMSFGELTLANDPRVLPFGRLLRKTKLNELPQLWNIIVGDLSLIGPRPQTRRYYDRYHNDDRIWIDLVRPGLSGVGSVLFRDEEALITKVKDPKAFDDEIITPYKGRVEKWFVINQSIGLYFELIVITILVVLFPSKKFIRRFMRRLPPPPPALVELLES